ncbi:MAG: DUF3467 domain-containing protein [Proteobacteria bacterium]|nr:DUF3467 domain-containing protein [Pseudomonadota bacterium]
MPNGQQDIKVYFPNEIKGGVYANNMVVAHTKEEFVMDFIMLAPPEGAVTARIVVSPGHVKRIFNALAENISRYEASFGTIEVAEEPKGAMGYMN